MDEKKTSDSAKIAASWVCNKCGSQACQELPSGTYLCAKELGGCGREIEMRSYRWRRGPDNQPQDVHINSRIVTRVALRLKSMSNPEQAFPQIAEEAAIPKNLWSDLRNEIERLYQAHEGSWVQLDSTRRITINEKSFDITVIAARGDDKVYPVIGRPFEIVRRLRIMEKVITTVRDNSGEFSGTTPEIRKRLDDNGQILNHRDAADVLAHLMSQVPIISRGHFTYGVYLEGDTLALPEHIVPRNDFQVEAVKALSPHMATQGSEEDWQAYADFFGLFHAHEWMPVAGLAAIAPLAPVLRAAKIISPAIMHLGEKGIGKSSVAEAVSKKLWAQDLKTANDMDSEFRLPAFLDSAAVPIVIDDAESFKFDEFGGHLKKSLESIRGASRGTSARSKDDFLNLASLVFTANHMPNLSESLLARFLIIEYDSSRKNMPAAIVAKFAATSKKLRTLGPSVARHALSMFDASFNKFSTMRENIEAEIRSLLGKWWDSRRPAVWSVLYLGVKILEGASRGKIQAPTVPEFFRLVIEPVERMTRQSMMDPIVLLRDMIQMWESTRISRAIETDGRNSYTVAGVQGEGKIIQRGTWENPPMPGHWITSAFLAEYNRQQGKRVEALIHDLGKCAQMVSTRYGVPLKDMVDKNGDAKAKKFDGGKNARAVFIPEIDPDQVPSRPVGSFGGGPAVGGNGGNGHASAQDTVSRVLAIIRGAGDAGAEVPLVAARASQEGIPAEVVTAAIDDLRKSGSIYSPTGDRVAAF